MDQVGKIEKKDGDMAAITVKNVLRCGDSCRHCSAGCNIESVLIHKKVDPEIREGDFVEIRSVKGANRLTTFLMYAIPATFIAGSILFIYLFTDRPDKERLAGIAAIVSLLLGEVVVQVVRKMRAKKNELNYRVGRKL
ncbi:MAG TPA: SoxR reducing system RseC family protein [Clostridiaceae bacterium]|nr:SoxR reducing system RseC family protein [Clostridiaceae bacterium]